MTKQTKSLTDLIAENHARQADTTVDVFGMRFRAEYQPSTSLKVVWVDHLRPLSEPVFLGLCGTPRHAAETILAARETL
jgi:hypothetical protein